MWLTQRMEEDPPSVMPWRVTVRISLPSVMPWRITPWHLPACWGTTRRALDRADAGADICYRSNTIQNVLAFLLEFLIRKETTFLHFLECVDAIFKR